MVLRLAAACLLSLALVAGPVGAAETAPTDTQAGTAETTLRLGEVTLSGLAVPLDGVSLGQLRALASTDPDDERNPLDGAFALSSVLLPGGLELTARSDGDTGHPGQSVPLPLGSLTAGRLTAAVEDGSARSTIEALTAEIDAALAGLRVTTEPSAVRALVDGDAASAINGAVIENVQLGLTDLLPLDILEQLPLGTLLDLLDALDLDLDLGALTGVLRDLREALDDLRAIETVMGAIDDLQGELADLAREIDAAVGSVAAAQATVDDLRGRLDPAAEIARLTAERDALQQQLNGLVCTGLAVDPLCATLQASIGTVNSQIAALQGQTADPSLQAALDSALADLASAEALVAQLNGLIDDVQDELATAVDLLNRLLDDLLALLDGINLNDLLALLQALLDGLAGADLLRIDRLAVGVVTVADAESSSAGALCQVEGVAVLGLVQQTPTCDTLRDALGGLDTALEDLLGNLPIAGTLPANLVTVQGPTVTTTEDGAHDDDYFVAESTVTSLRLAVESIELTQVVDDLLADLTAQVEAILAELRALTGTAGVGGLTAAQVPVDLAAVEAALLGLLADLGQLPVGNLLPGAATPAVGVSGPAMSAGSSFTAVATPGTGGPGAVPAGPGTPAQTSSGSLPATGAGLGLALLLLSVGLAGIWFLRRRAPQG